MFPRSSASRPRRHNKGKLNIRNLIYIFLGFIIVIYIFFLATSLPGGGVQQEKEQQQVVQNAKDNDREDDSLVSHRLREINKDAIDNNAEVSERSWVFNPKRTYVWLEVSFDGESIGKVTAELYSDIVPITTENFRVLVTGERKDEGLTYENCVCHRIIKNFVVQCGDFETGKGYGGRSIYGEKFDDEAAGLKLKHDKRYKLQMANSGKNTNGSQFCFMLSAQPHLNTKHVVFGEVVDGFEIVDKMETAANGAHNVVLVRGGQYFE